nr:hypothetical protein BaRGS_029748 [Batillaria attramentaria]
MAIATKLGGALLVALISNATLLSVLLTQRGHQHDTDNNHSSGDVVSSSHGAVPTASESPQTYVGATRKADQSFESRGGENEVLVPALIGLESLVLRELERLHDVNVNQELRLERLEKRQLQNEELLAAAATVREQEQQQEQQGKTSAQPHTTVLEGNNPVMQDESSAVIEEYSADAMLKVEEEGSGSGDEVLSMTGLTTPTTTIRRANNYTDSPDSAIINHIYEIYSSLTSMEHKVAEIGTSLSVVSSEIYRQRSAFINMEDKLEELRRNQRNLVMRTTVHTFKLSDLEQFKGQAEVLLQTTEGELEQFEGRLEAFKDRVTAQQDEMVDMRNVFGRLEQSATELRAADAYKAHDIQELKRGAMQMEQRLASLYHSLDRYIGNIRYDVRSILDHMCNANNLQC